MARISVGHGIRPAAFAAVTATEDGFAAELPEQTLVVDHVYEITARKVTDRFGLPLARDFKATFKAIAPAIAPSAYRASPARR